MQLLLERPSGEVFSTQMRARQTRNMTRCLSERSSRSQTRPAVGLPPHARKMFNSLLRIHAIPMESRGSMSGWHGYVRLDAPPGRNGSMRVAIGFVRGIKAAGGRKVPGAQPAARPALARRGPQTPMAAASGPRLPDSSRSRLGSGTLWIFGPGNGPRRQVTTNGLAPRAIPSGRHRAPQGQGPGQCSPQRVRFPPEEPWLPGSGLQIAPPP